MDGASLSQRTAQLDKAEREHLEDVVTEMRERVEDNVEYQLRQQGLDEEPDESDSLDEDAQQLVEAIELEAVDGHTWEEASEEYVTGVGYTIVNRLAALRCMEVRDFIAEEITVFKDNGLTPAAETLVNEEFLMEDEAILEAYHSACDELSEEIEILFDRSTPYSLVDPDDDTFEELCGMLDEIPDEVWRADDVLGWVYEYYNRPVVEALDAKNTLEPEDVGPANQFYTPHWVVRMLADNSLGKLYLEATNQEDSVPEPEALSPEERKDRLVTPADAPSVPELCTYLIPDEEPGDAPEFDHPRELRVIDPACGSGHFLLYAFDILERIWWAETDLGRAEIPAKVLEHNLYGVDIDLRSCQLSAFNLYLKARTRAEAEDGQFEMPNVGIVCADARVAEVEEATDVLDEITGKGSDLREALDDVIETFQHTEALGSLLDVSGTLEEAFDSSKTQAELSDYNGGAHQSLNSFLKALRRAVEDRTSDSFGEQNLRSFLNLLVVLTQEYDTALMNPPYGAQGRMPSAATDYTDERYEYGPEYYINFFEVCNNIAKQSGRVGMIVQRSFMYKSNFQNFREDFIGELGAFDFLAEYGKGVLDRATVRTAGTVVRTGSAVREDSEGLFYRLHDLAAGEKQNVFLESAFGDVTGDVKRKYKRELREFSHIPGSPLSYWVPIELRELFDSRIHLDSEKGNVEGESLGTVSVGLCTGDDGRFVKRFWETGDQGNWHPFAKGGEDAWILPRVNLEVNYSVRELRSQLGARVQNTDDYFSEALTYTYLKESGRRFGYLHKSSIFGHAGKVFLPDASTWEILGYLNTDLITYLMIAQTPERHWEVGEVSKLPWVEGLDEVPQIGDLTKKMAGLVISRRRHDFNSPHYTKPALLQFSNDDASLKTHSDHPHRGLIDKLELHEGAAGDKSNSIEVLAAAASKYLSKLDENMETMAERVKKAAYDHLEISEKQSNMIDSEIALRTNEKPRERRTNTQHRVDVSSEEVARMAKDLLLHFALRAVHEDDDGIVPISDVEGEDDLLTHIEGEFERVWGEYADARLAEVDDVLGSLSAAEEAYPNLRSWLGEDLFDYHVQKFDRTPILWRFTTERLVSDSEGEGFGCLVDYHRLDEGVFDRLQNRYLESRKNLLRERRSAANRRRSDDSLSASEQAEAAEEYARCESGLEQIAVFEDRLAELAQPDPRQWSTDEQQAADRAAERVSEFRRRTEERLAAVDELAALEDVDMAALFTGNFYEKVEEQREEWLDALDDLEDAFRAYAANADEPVPAHLYDLFDYYADDLLGSSHFASNGILYMTYYFDNFEQADQGRLDDAGISRRQRLISQLAGDLDEYTELSETIAEDCQSVSSNLSAEWEDRALSEITTVGYRPNHKHGVEINITPLAEAEIVPTIVDDKVL